MKIGGEAITTGTARRRSGSAKAAAAALPHLLLLGLNVSQAGHPTLQQPLCWRGRPKQCPSPGRALHSVYTMTLLVTEQKHNKVYIRNLGVDSRWYMIVLSTFRNAFGVSPLD